MGHHPPNMITQQAINNTADGGISSLGWIFIVLIIAIITYVLYKMFKKK